MQVPWARRAVGIIAVFTIGVGATLLWIKPDGKDLQQVLRDNGFVELRPASTLIQPGAWVEVQGRNPLRLRTVCSPETALNLSADQLAHSASTDTSITRAVSGSFKFGLAALGLGDLSTTSQAIEGIELHLTNVRLIELADDQILKNLPKRQQSCAQAIKLRCESDPKSLTMVDAVLIADAEYHLIFKGQTDAEKKSAAVEEITAKTNLSIDVNRKDSSVIVGSNLVWGVKDDQFMAYQGIALPSVGAETPGPRSILENSGPIEAIDSSHQARRTFDTMAVQIRLDVPAMKQPSPMSCWATVYTMLVSWKTKKPMTIEAAITHLGAPYTTYLAEDRGLPGGQELAFVEAAGLQALPPADWELSEFRQLLREKGPVWIITGDGITSHARLLVGLYGLDEAETFATYQATVMEFIDPAVGGYVYEPALSFYDVFEREAGYVVDHHLDWLDLRWQVISY